MPQHEQRSQPTLNPDVRMLLDVVDPTVFTLAEPPRQSRERNILSPHRLTSVKHLASKLMRYIRQYNKARMPWRWSERRRLHLLQATATSPAANSVQVQGSGTSG